MVVVLFFIVAGRRSHARNLFVSRSRVCPMFIFPRRHLTKHGTNFVNISVREVEGEGTINDLYHICCIPLALASLLFCVLVCFPIMHVSYVSHIPPLPIPPTYAESCGRAREAVYEPRRTGCKNSSNEVFDGSYRCPHLLGSSRDSPTYELKTD